MQNAVTDQVNRVKGSIGEKFLLREAEESEAASAPTKEVRLVGDLMGFAQNKLRQPFRIPIAR